MKRRSRPGKAARRARARKSSRKSPAKKRASPKKAASSKRRNVFRHSKRKSKPSKKRKHQRRASSPRVKPSQSMMFEPLEQVTVACSNCGRQFSIVKLRGLSMEGMICQRCSIGEVEFPES